MLYGYARVSTTEQVDGTSLGDQRRKVEGVAMIRGESVEEIFEVWEPNVGGGKADRGSQNKVSWVAAVPLNETEYRLYLKLSPFPGFTRQAIVEWE